MTQENPQDLSNQSFDLYNISSSESTSKQTYGYVVVSNAPTILDEASNNSEKKELDEFYQNLKINKISIETLVDELFDTGKEPKEIVIEIHGYNTANQSVISRYKEINQQIPNIINKKNVVFIGFRWPSETLKLTNIKDAFSTMPFLLFWTFWIGVTLLFLISTSLDFDLIINLQSFDTFLFKPVLTLLGIFLSILSLIVASLFFSVSALILLRLSVYFRDNYRASNFAVLDLIELIKELDFRLYEKKKLDKLFNKIKEEHNNIFSNKCFCNLKDEQQKIMISIIIDAHLYFINEWKKHIYECTILNSCESNVDMLIQRILEDELKSLENNTPNISNKEALIYSEFKNFWFKKIEDIVYKMRKDKKFENCHFINEKNFECLLQNILKFLWCKDLNITDEIDTKSPRIKLSFIGHSMGAFVTTNVVRILSDVFDDNTTQIINNYYFTPDNNFSDKIGHCFSLKNLVLVAPDIPVGSITSGRSNFLRSSLPRFKEAYLFTNESDLVLRVASTIANYFIYPAKKLFSGYRLGNLAIKSDDSESYGIINLSNSNISDYLKINILWKKEQSVSGEIEEYLNSKNQDHKKFENIENKFTYFDCTNYVDFNLKKTPYNMVLNSDSLESSYENILSLPISSQDKSLKRLCIYIKLFIFWLLFLVNSKIKNLTTKVKKYTDSVKNSTTNVENSTRKIKEIDSFKLYISELIIRFLEFISSFHSGIDVHGGYFEGHFSVKAIYGLAFLGFEDFLKVVFPEENTTREERLQKFNKMCQNQKIRVLLSSREKIE